MPRYDEKGFAAAALFLDGYSIKGSHGKARVLRNMIAPEIGKYLFDLLTKGMK